MGERGREKTYSTCMGRDRLRNIEAFLGNKEAGESCWAFEWKGGYQINYAAFRGRGSTGETMKLLPEGGHHEKLRNSSRKGDDSNSRLKTCKALQKWNNCTCKACRLFSLLLNPVHTYCLDSSFFLQLIFLLVCPLTPWSKFSIQKNLAISFAKLRP